MSAGWGQTGVSAWPRIRFVTLCHPDLPTVARITVTGGPASGGDSTSDRRVWWLQGRHIGSPLLIEANGVYVSLEEVPQRRDVYERPIIEEFDPTAAGISTATIGRGPVVNVAAQPNYQGPGMRTGALPTDVRRPMPGSP